MKKLSLLLVLAVLLSVGGVYATWTYASTDAISAVSTTASITLTGVTEEGAVAYGAYSIDATSMALQVDQDESRLFNTVLEHVNPDAPGAIVITFTASGTAPFDIQENGVTSYFYPDHSIEDAKFDDGHGAGARSIFYFEDATGYHTIYPVGEGLAGDGSDEWKPAPGESGKFTFTIPADEFLAHHFKHNVFVLDTRTLYDAFDVAMPTTVKIFISDVQPEA